MISKNVFGIRKNGEPYSNCLCRTPELIENYEEAINDKNELWCCHHKMEEVFSKAELIRAGWYYDRRPEELIFIRCSEHNRNPKIHIEVRRKNENRKGRKLSEEHKKKISDANKGKKYGPLSKEHKQKLSEAAKNRKDNYYCGNAGRGKTWKVINGKRVWLDK